MGVIKGSTALVTGANRGIGKAFVTGLLARGAVKVYAAARNTHSLAPLVADHGDRVVPLTLDVTREQDVADAVARAGDISLLINNAGTAAFSSFTAEDAVESAREEMETNYIGPLRLSRAFAPVLKANGGGAIINLGSIASYVNFPVLGTYSASKAAVHSLTQGLRAQLAGQATQVLGVYPGPVDTDMAAGFDTDKTSPEAVVKAILDALEQGEDSVFPDVASSQLHGQFQADPSATAQAVGQAYLPA
ncbi:SDR family oxidoreductase [Roseibium aestuarii]|uniref:SDR family oxidoreductase n=1 Tax=Roseibium aestuarii TaxID=2600299 RepID=A0ABW4JWB1_9HYPH|nr:SDR family oxidoreductase [Roseibium aestuarii]